MARPRKEIECLRNKLVSVRLTSLENDFARKQAELAGISIANYLRISALSKKELHAKVTPLQLAHYKELRSIGVNINQIAKKLNQNKFTKIHEEIMDVKQLLSKIYFLFQK